MQQPAFSLPSFAKINLGLRVIGKRNDGFHDIFTIYQTVSLHDTLTFTRSGEITLTCSDDSIPCDEHNLISRAANLLRTRSRAKGLDAGAHVHLEKQIPSPGGLGGGSSNAAAALIGLARLWELEICRVELTEIAGQLGSDVPFFLTGGTAVGVGRGTDIEPLHDLEAGSVLIVTPNIAVSTAAAFNALNAATLTKSDADHILQICRLEAGSSDFILATMRNDFESAVFAMHPEIGTVKERLLELGATQALLAGSGASVFGLFDIEETRQTAMKALDEQVNWRKFAVATISRKEYREALQIVF